MTSNFTSHHVNSGSCTIRNPYLVHTWSQLNIFTRSGYVASIMDVAANQSIQKYHGTWCVASHSPMPLTLHCIPTQTSEQYSVRSLIIRIHRNIHSYVMVRLKPFSTTRALLGGSCCVWQYATGSRSLDIDTRMLCLRVGLISCPSRHDSLALRKNQFCWTLSVLLKCKLSRIGYIAESSKVDLLSSVSNPIVMGLMSILAKDDMSAYLGCRW